MVEVLPSLSKRILCVLVACACALYTPAVAFADLTAGSSNALKTSEVQTEAQQEDKLSTQEAALTHVGIDVSEHQGTINWASVAKSNVKFAIVRCSDSVNVNPEDKQWINNTRGCLQNNIPMGVYIYSRATTVEMARSEAQHVIDLLKKASLNATNLALPIYMDIETADQKNASPATMKTVFEAFKSVLNANGYSKVGVYASSSVWAGSLREINLAAEYRWVAAYNPVGPYYGYAEIESKGSGIWQYSSTGRVSGISGNSDMNKARADLRFLEQSGNARNMYRLYNPYTGEHFYTSSASECGNLEGVGWRYEGVGWRAPLSSGIPVYRLYNPYAPGGDHHYTTSKSEYDHLITVGWRGEGISWYSAWVDQVATYRLYNPYAATGTHHYTTSESERDGLVKLGWRYEGRTWYGLK